MQMARPPLTTIFLVSFSQNQDVSLLFELNQTEPIFSALPSLNWFGLKVGDNWYGFRLNNSAFGIDKKLFGTWS
jgi:hypothetical protein